MCRRDRQSECNPVVQGLSFDLCSDCPAANSNTSCVPTVHHCQRGCVIYRDGHSAALFRAMAGVAQAGLRYWNSDQEGAATSTFINEILRIVFEFMSSENEENAGVSETEDVTYGGNIYGVTDITDEGYIDEATDTVGEVVTVEGDLFGGSPLVGSSPPWDRRGHHRRPGNLWGGNTRPYPTNVWWQNMVNEPAGDMVNTVNPYQVKTKDDGLHVCLPAIVNISSFEELVLMSP